MKKLLAVALFLCTQTVLAADQAGSDAQAIMKAAAAAEREAGRMTSHAIFKEVERISALQQERRSSNPGSFWSDPDLPRIAGLMSALEARHKGGESLASYYWALLNAKSCGGLAASLAGRQQALVDDCWQATLSALKFASEAGNFDAAFSVARMYEHGYGVAPSRFVAADWYVKAATGFMNARRRDEALSTVEAALNAAPDHPGGLRLKALLLR